MAMEREAWPGDSDEQEPASGEGEDPGKHWYFDLPGGAWERQEEKNRNLRQSVLENIEGESRRRTFPGTEVDPEEQRGRFGRRKKQHEAPPESAAGGTFQLRHAGVDADTWKHRPDEDGGWDADDEDEAWREQVAEREAARGRKPAEPARGRECGPPEDVADPDSMPLILHRRRPVEPEAQQSGGRWSDAFGGQGESVSTGSGWGEGPAARSEERPRRRRILPEAAPDAMPEDERRRQDVRPEPVDEASREPMQLRRQEPEGEAPRPEPVVERRDEEKQSSRWDEMLSAQADDGGFLEGMRQWSEGAKGRSRRKLVREPEPDVRGEGDEEEPRSRRDETFSAPADENSLIEGMRKWTDSAKGGSHRDEEPEPEQEPSRDEGDEEKPRSRWDEMFSAPADDGSFLEGMRQWSEAAKAKPREERPRARWREKFGTSEAKVEQAPAAPEEEPAVPPESRWLHEQEQEQQEADRRTAQWEENFAPSDWTEPEEPARPRGHRVLPEAGSARSEERARPPAQQASETAERVRREEQFDRPGRPYSGPPEREPDDYRGALSGRRWDEEEEQVRPARSLRRILEDARVDLEAGREATAPQGRKVEAAPETRWETRWDDDDHFEEPELDEDLNLFRGTPEQQPAVEPPAKERKGRGLARIFGRRKEPEETQVERFEPPAEELSAPREELRGPRRPVWDERDWGTVEQREPEGPPPWIKPDDDEDDPETVFLRRTLERARREVERRPDEGYWEEREDWRPEPHPRAAREWDEQGRPPARRSFTAPDEEFEEARYRDDMPRRTEPIERTSVAEAREERPPVSPARKGGQPRWTPERYDYDEADEPQQGPAPLAKWQPEPLDTVEEQPRRSSRFVEAEDDEDPWAGFLAGRKDSPRTRPERYAQSARDDMPGGREEPRWSE